MKRVLASFVVMSTLFLPAPSHAQLNSQGVEIGGCQALAVAGAPASCPATIHRSVFFPGDNDLPDDQNQGATTLFKSFNAGLDIRNLEPDPNSANACNTSALRALCHTLTSTKGFTDAGAACTPTLSNTASGACDPIFDSDGTVTNNHYIAPLDLGHFVYGERFAMAKGSTVFNFACLIHPTMRGQMTIICDDSRGCHA